MANMVMPRSRLKGNIGEKEALEKSPTSSRWCKCPLFPTGYYYRANKDGIAVQREILVQQVESLVNRCLEFVFSSVLKEPMVGRKSSH